MILKLLHRLLIIAGLIILSPIYIVIWIISGLTLITIGKEPLPFIPDLEGMAAEQRAKERHAKRREARLKAEKKAKKAKKKAKKLAKQQKEQNEK